jgi:hypothetical protein
MAFWFYGILLGAVAISLVIGYGSLAIVSFFMLLCAMFFGTLLPTGMAMLIYLIFGLSWGKILYDIFSSRKAA